MNIISEIKKIGIGFIVISIAILLTAIFLCLLNLIFMYSPLLAISIIIFLLIGLLSYLIGTFINDGF
jgi:hypothetical protein